MRRSISPLLVLVLLCPAFAGTRDEQWKSVDEAVNKGLPKTAIERLQPIIQGAMQEKAYAEAIKAVARRIALEGNIQGNQPEEKITRMRAEIAKSPQEMVPVMEAILANWYWHYFQQNRWRFMQRTATTEAPGDDFTTWDLKRIFTEIDKQFGTALTHSDQLKTTPVAQYDDLLNKGALPDSYRPTMFDFLAHNALEFYTAAEQAGARSQDAFDLMSDSPIFASLDDFLAWKIKTTDTDSPTVNAIQLYQQLLQFHRQDNDPAALIDANLARLVFGKNKAFGEDKDERFKASMKRFTDRWGDHPIAARALHQWATTLQAEEDLIEAHRLATRGMEAFPASAGGKLCYNLIQSIESKSSQVTTERVWNQPLPTIQVRYRNITRVYFRIVAFAFEERLRTAQNRPEYLSPEERVALLRKPAVRQWSVDLPATEDYAQRTHEISAPEDMSPGSYYLIASHDPQFGDKENVVSYDDFWVSDLALVIRSRRDAGTLQGFVLNAVSGEPISGATVQSWYRGRNALRTTGPAAATNRDGLFSLRLAPNQSALLYVKHEGHALATASEHRIYNRNSEPRVDERTVFFTDRSLYRPGQTVQYKGICIRVDQQRDDYATIADRVLNVVFMDRNGKEIARQQQRSNDYGSFSGSFTAPRDRVTGQMSIRVDGGPRGTGSFHVEEYKRPKFQAAIERPEQAVKLLADVTVTGKATAYTGAAINDAKLRYRVVREVQYPIWWGWCYWWRQPQSNSQEITHGSAVTGADGKFEITFHAAPDRSVAEKDEPVFRYTIHADITDSTGETRSAQQSIRVGYTALQATLSATDWQASDQAVQIAVRTTTLDGIAQQAEGSLRIHRLQQPKRVRRSSLFHSPRPYRVDDAEPAPDWSNPNSWPLAEVVAERGFTTDASGNVSYSFALEAGIYRAVLTTQDKYGKPVSTRLPIEVIDTQAKKYAVKVPQKITAETWTLEPGDSLAAVWGSGYSKARAFVEIEHRRKTLKSFWTDASRTQVAIEQEITEAMRGGLTLHVTMVRENRAYMTSRRIDVPWTNKQLQIRWEHFTSKLGPAEKDTWTAIITGPNAKKAVAEMAATLYDASLDAYYQHSWPSSFNVFRYDYARTNWQFENHAQQLQRLHGNWTTSHRQADLSYRSFPPDVTTNFWGYGIARRQRMYSRGAMPMAAAAPRMEMAMDGAMAEGEPAMAAASADSESLMQKASTGGVALNGAAPAEAPKPDLNAVSARTNLNETAFFFPHLVSNKEGEVRLEFTMPEALTEWRFLGFAHDSQLRAGLLQDKVVTAKDLMVQPNPPRFLREGDQLEFTVKVSNQSAAGQTGTVRLALTDARTGEPVDQALGNMSTDLSFDVPSMESRSYAWKLDVPDDMGYLTYKAVGSTGRLSDGEEGYLPVLSRRILVTESLPLPIQGSQTKQFRFTHLLESGKSETLQHQNVTVQMVSNPAWYAVMALPYLMEFPHECTEQTFNRLYANALARHIANSDPKVRRVFDQWKATPALDSPLEKNQDLKAVLIEETPWLRQAQAESQARRNVGILFDDNRLNTETDRILAKLTELQDQDGGWCWFPGGRSNDYITMYITTGFGRLRHLGADVDVAVAIKALDSLDRWVNDRYRWILEHNKEDSNNLSPRIAFYLYGRSFFLRDKAIPAESKEAVAYFQAQAKKYWLQLTNRQSQGHLAIALKRFGDRQTAMDIMRSIHERSVTDDEMGMFWRETELSWWWYRAPIETQALMIEAFDEVAGDTEAVEQCKVWLLKQKQTQDWKTTKATADAVYSLLLRGTDLLTSDALVEVSVGDLKIEPKQVEAGTGFYEQRFGRGEVKAEMGQVTVKKTDRGVAWGSIHWQYLEDMSKIEPYEGTPLKLKKQLYVKEYTDQGPVLKPVRDPLAVGDELVVRIELRVDRDMEYIHLKDYRGSGTEPVNVLSRYKYQDGLGYYESTRDTASHFFIDYLPKGVYVFEYSTRVVHRGQYQTGVAQIQCMYAPEFNSHSESLPIVVQ